MTQPVLTTGLLREAMSGSSRRSRLEEAEAKARYNAEKARIEADFKKRFKIDHLSENVRAIESALKDAENELEKASRKMHAAMAERIAELEDKKADSLASIGARSAERDFKLLGLSLPPEARQILEIDDLKVGPDAARLLTSEKEG